MLNTYYGYNAKYCDEDGAHFTVNANPGDQIILNIGQLKVGELERYEDPAALDLMRRIKRVIDPHGIMNPGKVLRDSE